MGWGVACLFVRACVCVCVRVRACLCMCVCVCPFPIYSDPYLAESELHLTRVWLPIQAEYPFHVPCFNGKVHEAEGRFKVSISCHESGYQSLGLDILREAYRPNLERGQGVVSPTSTLPKVSFLLLLTWEVVNSGAWSLTSVILTAISQVLLRPEAGTGFMLVRLQ